MQRLCNADLGDCADGLVSGGARSCQGARSGLGLCAGSSHSVQSCGQRGAAGCKTENIIATSGGHSSRDCGASGCGGASSRVARGSSGPSDACSSWDTPRLGRDGAHTPLRGRSDLAGQARASHLLAKGCGPRKGSCAGQVTHQAREGRRPARQGIERERRQVRGNEVIAKRRERARAILLEDAPALRETGIVVAGSRPLPRDASRPRAGGTGRRGRAGSHGPGRGAPALAPQPKERRTLNPVHSLVSDGTLEARPPRTARRGGPGRPCGGRGTVPAAGFPSTLGRAMGNGVGPIGPRSRLARRARTNGRGSGIGSRGTARGNSPRAGRLRTSAAERDALAGQIPRGTARGHGSSRLGRDNPCRVRDALRRAAAWLGGRRRRVPRVRRRRGRVRRRPLGRRRLFVSTGAPRARANSFGEGRGGGSRCKPALVGRTDIPRSRAGRGRLA